MSTAVKAFEIAFGSKWLQNVVESSCKGKMSKCEVEAVDGGKGAESLIRANFSWESESLASQLFPRSILIKIQEPFETHGAVDFIIKHIKEKEKKEQIAKDLRPIEHLRQRNECAISCWFDKRKEDGLKVPRHFHAKEISDNKPGIILLEDFHEVEAKVCVSDGLTFEQLRSAVDAIAAWQAVSLTDTSWTAKVQPVPDLAEAKGLAFYFEELKKKLRQSRPGFLEKGDHIVDGIDADVFIQLRDSHKKLGLAPVLCHGGLTLGNVKFDKRDPTKLLAAVNWKNCHAGNCAEDLCRLLVGSAPAELRRSQTDALLERYHSQLAERLQRAPPFTLDDVKKAYAAMLGPSTKLSLMRLPKQLAAIVGDGPPKAKQLDALFKRAKCAVEDVIAAEN